MRRAGARTGEKAATTWGARSASRISHAAVECDNEVVERFEGGKRDERDCPGTAQGHGEQTEVEQRNGRPSVGRGSENPPAHQESHAGGDTEETTKQSFEGGDLRQGDAARQLDGHRDRGPGAYERGGAQHAADRKLARHGRGAVPPVDALVARLSGRSGGAPGHALGAPVTHDQRGVTGRQMQPPRHYARNGGGSRYWAISRTGQSRHLLACVIRFPSIDQGRWRGAP